MLVIAAPGQGAQTPGFLSPWLEFPGVAERIGTWSEIVGCDLVKYGTVGDADEIRDTAVAQPLLVAAALAAARVLGIAARVHGGIAAGHSVGELAVGAIGGIVAGDDAMRLVGVRARAMAKAAAAESTSMTAVLGGDEAEVLAAIASHGLTPANINGAGQIVAAGTVAQLADFAANPPRGAKLRPLQVAGAFHTAHMASAVDALREAAATVEVRDPVLTVLSNADGAAVPTGADWLGRIVAQVSAPVRWDLCMASMRSRGATCFIELPPAGTLTALARRALPGIALLALKTPAELDAARTLIADHADSHSDSHAPEWRLLVASLAGTFRAVSSGAALQASAALDASTVLPAGTVLGQVQTRGGATPVVADFAATIIEWLAEDGDPVSPGQPLVRLQPAEAE
jgi:[acyl-carrier-protein] S-malonyltransferase